MASQQEPFHTPAEYLAFERAAETKHEYLDGRIYAMSGGSRSHARIAVNLIREISTQLRGRPCEAFGSDMRVRVEATGLRTYPDLSALCGEPRFDDEVRDTLVNPELLIEVLSPSTESYDRGQKFEHYRQIPELQEYVLFAQDRALAEYRIRRGEAGDQWGLKVVRGLDAALELPAIGCVLSLRGVYERVELLPDPPLRAVYEDAMSAGYAANQTST
jgi:Uma2 family endonuclease